MTQSTGLAEINTAVSTIDQGTQQNAAMVEETSAASQSLASEAEQLNRLLAGFELGRSPAADGRDGPRQGARAAAAPVHVAASRPAGGPALSAGARYRTQGSIALAEPGRAAQDDGWEEF